MVLAAALAGCGVSSAPSEAGSPSAASTGSAAPTSPNDTGAIVAPVPEAESDSQVAAVEAATAALTAYAQPELPYQEWVNGLYPYLTQAGASAYEDTDPARIPVREVTGQGIILPASTEVALIVQLPTDAGNYNVSLSRPNAESAWLADRIRPADG
ncbi:MULTISPECIES: hypothetical protein [unclassified Microbacterium]|uniref:hypothetical protein n=1 Tax=unclassified Microbacterium TaxID=2609290 RepID=UPI003C2CA426